MNMQNRDLNMKKKLLPLFMSLLFVTAAEGYAQECCYEDNYSYEDPLLDEDIWWYEDSCCVAQTPFYARIFGGANFLQHTAIARNRAKYGTGYVVAGSLGYCGCYGLCLEGEYAFRRNAIKNIRLFGEGIARSGHFQTSSYMANLLWELPLASWGCPWRKFRPFIGAGIGYDEERMRALNSRIRFHQRWHHFSWQVMAGLAYPIFCNTDLTVEYKFHQGGSHFYTHAVGVGLVYQFGLGLW